MDTAILTGLISAGAAIVVCLVNNHYQSIEADKRHETTISLISYRLEQLEQKVDKHNNIIERIYALEKRTDVIEEKIKVANNRLADLEDDAK